MHCCRCLFQENRKLHREYDRYIEVFKKYRSHRNYTTLCQSWLSPGGGGGGKCYTSPSPAVESVPAPWWGDSLGDGEKTTKLGVERGTFPPVPPRTLRRGTAEVTGPLEHSHGANSPYPSLSQLIPTAIRGRDRQRSHCVPQHCSPPQAT